MMYQPRTLSTGEPSTLGTYRRWAVALAGEGSQAVQFVDGKIAESPRGGEEPVIADERQMLTLLASML